MIYLTLGLVLVYVVSIYYSYRFMQLAHYNIEGKWLGVDPTATDVVIVFLPLVNTVWTLEYFLNAWKHKDYRKTNFFKTKK